MGLSATRFFKHWPELAQEYDSISLNNVWIETFKHSGERMIPPMKAADRLRAAGLDPSTPPGTFQMRPLVYQMFARQVEKLGVRIELGKRVVDYYEDEERRKAGVITESGERVEADLVIAADGEYLPSSTVPYVYASSDNNPSFRSGLKKSKDSWWASESYEIR